MQELQETQVQSLDQEDPLAEAMATHFRILAWRIPWTEEPGMLQSIASNRVRLSMHTLLTPRHFSFCTLLLHKCHDILSPGPVQRAGGRSRMQPWLAPGGR